MTLMMYILVDRVYHVLSWGLPAVISCFPFISGVYGPAELWWYVTAVRLSNNESHYPEKCDPTA